MIIPKKLCAPRVSFGDNRGQQRTRGKQRESGACFRSRRKLGWVVRSVRRGMVEFSLHHHMEITYGIVLPHTRGLDVSGGGAETYFVSFPQVLNLVAFLEDGCPARVNNPGRIRVHFMYPHWKSNL